MSIANKSIYPHIENGEVGERYGMTLLEHYAGLAMQGLCANPNLAASNAQIADVSVGVARALIAELEKEKQA